MTNGQPATAAIHNIAKLKKLQTANADIRAATSPIESVKAAQALTRVLIELGFLGGNQAKSQTSEADPQTSKAGAASAIVDRSDIAVPIKVAARQHANNDAVALLKTIQEDGLTRDDLSDEQIETLVKYTGSGGGLEAKKENGKKVVGSQYEYYTPPEIASAMWGMAAEMGFSGGKVLDPSAGTGIFAATSPDSAVIDSIELDATSGGIAQVLNDGARSNTIVSPFEAQAKLIADDSLDMVMTNVPFGDNKTRGANKLEDDSYQNESLEGYFILRSLEKIKAGGLAIFITPTSVVSGKQSDKLRLRKLTSLKAEFMGAYRMPTEIFDQTGANVVTDVVVYRKYSREAAEQITGLYNSGDLDTLSKTHVFWDDYLSGNYFNKESRKKKFILGDEVQATNQWGKEYTAVRTNPKNPAVSKMLKKFGDSRIDWELLGAAEAEIIEYKDGDTVFQDGKQLKRVDGGWQVVEKEVTDTEREIQDLLASMGGAHDMVVADLTFDKVSAVTEYCKSTGQAGLIPSDTLKMIERCMKSAPANRAAAWRCIIAAQAVQDAIAEHDYGYDFKSGQPILTAYLKTAFLDGKNSKLTGDAKQDHKLVDMYYAKGKYHAVWRGDIDATIKDDGRAKNYKSVLARIQYENKSLYLTPEQLKKVDAEADPITNDAWFINHDGSQIIAANDFMVGSLADRLADIDKQIALATDDDIKAKLVKQKAIARDNVTRIDVKKIDIDLRTPLISADNKVLFLKQSVHKNAYIAYNEAGRGIPDIDVKGGSKNDKASKKDKDKLYNRIGDWLAKGTVTLGGVELDTMSQREALDWMTDEINKANIKFSLWVKSNKSIMAELEAKMTDEKNLYFTQNADETPLDIAGMNPKLSLHGYQNAQVRNQGRFFGGINGFGVGLGKTFTALSSVQHVHNIGVKKKTLFIVPNSVLSNWRKEAAFAYQNTDDCIFIGLREKGDKFRVSSNKYDEDLLEAINGKYRKIFMTFEAFKRIRLKDDTIYDYAQYIKKNDTAFEEKHLQKDDEKTKGLTAALIKRLAMRSNAPYLEDMNIDSVVIDEAHAYKNSITAPNTDDRIKYLSQPDQSARGEDAQAKLWYVRSITPNNDGVQLLTATPITNSPLEIYSMMSLASGRETVNRMCGGIVGADDFVQIMCQIKEETMPTIDGGERSQNVFTGIRNAQMLRSMIGANAVIKDASDVGMSVVIPDRDETATEVDLGEDIMNQIAVFQDAYTVAKQLEKDQLSPELNNPAHPLSPYNPTSPINTIMNKYGEDAGLVAQPFNLIRKMDVTIADAEFAERATFYDFDASQEKLAQKVIDQFNKKGYKEKRARLSPYTHDDDVAENYVKDGDRQVLRDYTVTSQAKIIFDAGRDRIVVDTLNGKTQSRFEELAEKAKLNLDVTIPPKIAAMLDNFKTEQATPRGANDDGTTSRIVKQIIFCDHLFLHNKIKRALVKRAGVPAAKIAIITGQINNEPDEMIDVQDGFNAQGEDNQYYVIIANKKAEVGINLQRGTQAIHHLTTGWTPDSLEQRNGRGARQGNKTDKVAIYHYDANGTFDEFKRTMIDKKDEWITSVLKDDGKNTIKVSGAISRAEQDALISTMGNKEAMREYQATKDAKEAEARKAEALKRQSINMDVLKEQSALMSASSAESFYNKAVIDVISIVRDNQKLFTANEKSKAKPETRAKNEARYENTKQVAIDKIKDVLGALTVQVFEYNADLRKSVPVGDKGAPPRSAEAVYDSLMDNTKDYPPSKVNEWVDTFNRSQAVGKSTRGWGDKVEINEGSIYHDAYEEAKETATSLINESIIAINNIADDMGVEGVDLPANAGEHIAKKEAVILNDVYIQVGSLVIYDNGASRPNDIYVARSGANGLTLSTLKKVGYSSNSPIDIVNENPERIRIKLDMVVTPNDSRYLDHLKDMAKFEDDLNYKGELSHITTKYSDMIPEVAEYRDDSVVPTFELKNSLHSSHARINGGTVAIMLTQPMLKAGTPFAKYALKQYANNGLDVNADAGTFTVSNDDITISRDAVYGAAGFYMLALADIVKQSGVKLTRDDEDIMNNEDLIYKFIKADKEMLIAAVKSAQEAVTADTDPATLDSIASGIYDKHLHNSDIMADMPNDVIKIELVNKFYKEAAAMYGRSFNLVNTLERKIKDLIMSEASKANNGGVAIEDDDIVYIGGNTKDHKDDIKAYGNRKGRAKWHGKDGVWAMRYDAYKDMISAKPSLDGELTMSTTK